MVHYKRLFYFDLETTTDYKDFDDFKKQNPVGAKTFELKHHRAKINGDNYWQGTVEESYINRAPLLGDYGKIIVISYGFFKGDEFLISSKTISDFNSEKEFMLFIARLLNRAEQRNFVLSGHNIKRFDIPFIFKKMLKYSIKIPNIINFHNKKPWEMILEDTGELTKANAFTYSSLADVTYLLGISTPKNDIDGSDVHRVYWEDNDIERIKKYCEKDVIAVKEIAKRLSECLN